MNEKLEIEHCIRDVRSVLRWEVQLGAFPGGKVLCGDIFRNKVWTFSVFFTVLNNVLESSIKC